MKKYKVLCVFSRLLGGKTFSLELENILVTLPQLDCTFLNFDAADYKDFKAPFIYKISDSLETIKILKKKLKKTKVDIQDFDILLFQSYQLTAPFKNHIGIKPTIIALDATPKSARRGNYQTDGPSLRIRALLGETLDWLWFQKIFRRTNFFLARTGVVKKSLESDYRIPANRIEVTYLPTQISTNRQRTLGDWPRILFVGNDFERKGGWFILEAHQKYLSEKCELVIVSNDPSLKKIEWSKAVTYKGGLPRDELLKLYLDCDIYVLPTFKDELGLGICEAMAAGLPVVARDATAQHEIVIDGKTGYLMPYQSSIIDWVEKLSLLIENGQIRRELGHNGQQFACEHFGYEAFKTKLELAFSLACAGVIYPPSAPST